MPQHWLELHDARRYEWRKLRTSSDEIIYRRLGIVENLFDSDGVYFEGRADLHQNIQVEVKTRLSASELRDKIVLAWTLMRGYHILMACKSCHIQDIDKTSGPRRWTDKCFAYTRPSGVDEAILEARSNIDFIEDTYPNVDLLKFDHHVKNTARALDPSKSLSRLFVMPATETSHGTLGLHFVVILAHQITDGLTSFRWGNHLSELLNYSDDKMRTEIQNMYEGHPSIAPCLPPAQEALYPARSKSLSRDRWHWAITRILRHVKKTPLSAFQNPLRRDKPLAQRATLSPEFSPVLNYERMPPVSSGTISVDLGERATRNLVRMCKSGGFSVGSGCFALVALVMMGLEEQHNPDVKPEHRLPFVGSFPVNPRPFLTESTTGRENSCMLAFSDGITLPFLSSDLNIVGRFKLLGKLAHKQLRRYQKRKRSLQDEVELGSKSPSQLLPTLFLKTMEGMEARARPEHKAYLSPQGKYPAKVSPTGATCGISSVGDVTGLLSIGKHDVHAELGGKDLIADLRDMGSVVRPREGEFLVAAVSKNGRVAFGAAYDADMIDPAKAEHWKLITASILDGDLDLDDAVYQTVADAKTPIGAGVVAPPVRHTKL